MECVDKLARVIKGYAGYALVTASALGFALMPYFAVNAYRAGLDAPTLLMWRFVIAAVALFSYAALTGVLVRPTRRQLAVAAVMGGVGYAVMSASFFTAVQHISPALTGLLLYLYPALVALWSSILDRRRPARRIVAALLISFAGNALAVGRVESANLVGVLLGVTAAVTYSVYITIGDRLAQGLPPVVLTAYVCLFAGLTFSLFGLVKGTLLTPVPAAAWPSVGLVAIVSTVMAIGCFFAGMASIGATRASIVSTVEPGANIVFGAVLFASPVTGVQLAGAALVLTGALLGMLTPHPTIEETHP